MTTMNTERPSPKGKRVSLFVTFISGPSRTVDIEIPSILGVYEPGKLHVILLND